MSHPELPQSSGRLRLFFLFVAVLAFGGVVDSAVALQRHYAKSITAFCDIAQRFNCDVVNRSQYSTVVGIPVAGIGIAGYAFLLFLATLARSGAETPNRLLGAAVGGLLFALYLTYIEAYELETWCILCLISLALISLITILSIFIRRMSGEA